VRSDKDGIIIIIIIIIIIMADLKQTSCGGIVSFRLEQDWHQCRAPANTVINILIS